MIFFITYLTLSINLLNLVDKPVDISESQIYIIISGPSCHECLQNTNTWISESELEATAVIWYNKTIIQKKQQIEIYKDFISPKTWTFSKDLEKLNNQFNLQNSPNIVVVKDGKTTYFPYLDLFTNKTKVKELRELIK